MTDFHDQDKPISEQFRLVAKKFVEHDKAARLLEECKSATLSQKIQDHIEKNGDMPHNQAEREVKASKDWHNYLHEMVNERSEANLKKVQLEFIRMQFTEWQMNTATARDERKLMKVHA